MGASLGRTRLLLGWGLATVGNIALAAVLLSFDRGPVPTYEPMLFLALVVITALLSGRSPAVICVLVGLLALDYWFVEPIHTLEVTSGADMVTLIVFAALSTAIAGVVDSAARSRESAAEARAEAEALAGLNRTLLASSYDIDGLLGLARTTFGAEAAELLPDDSMVAFGDTVVELSGNTILVLRGVSLEPRDRRILDAFAAHLDALRHREET